MARTVFTARTAVYTAHSQPRTQIAGKSSLSSAIASPPKYDQDVVNSVVQTTSHTEQTTEQNNEDENVFLVDDNFNDDDNEDEDNAQDLYAPDVLIQDYCSEDDEDQDYKPEYEGEHSDDVEQMEEREEENVDGPRYHWRSERHINFREESKDAWSCPQCTFSNNHLLPSCEMCECPRHNNLTNRPNNHAGNNHAGNNTSSTPAPIPTPTQNLAPTQNPVDTGEPDVCAVLSNLSATLYIETEGGDDDAMVNNFEAPGARIKTCQFNHIYTAENGARRFCTTDELNQIAHAKPSIILRGDDCGAAMTFDAPTPAGFTVSDVFEKIAEFERTDRINSDNEIDTHHVFFQGLNRDGRSFSIDWDRV